MDALIVSLVLAVGSGLTYLAYRHPFAYKIVGPCLMIAIGMFGLQAISVNYGSVRSSTRSLRKLAEENPDTRIGAFAKSYADDDESFRIINIAVLILLGAEGYLTFLFWLPTLIDHDKQEKLNQAQLSKAVRELQDMMKQYEPVKPTQEQEHVKPKR